MLGRGSGGEPVLSKSGFGYRNYRGLNPRVSRVEGFTGGFLPVRVS